MIDRYLSPAELKRLVSALLAVMGFIALAAFFGFIVVPGLRYQAKTYQDSPVQGVAGATGWLDPTDYPAARKESIPPIDPKTVMVPSAELLEKGKGLYQQTCATCHGGEGRGDGPGAKGLNPVPRNLTAGEGWKNGSAVEAIYRTLEEGIKGSSMAAYKDLRRKDRMALVHYVRSLGRFGHQPSDPQRLAALEQSFASAGEVIPNRIPVKWAQEKLTLEFRPASLTVASPLLKRYVLDAQKAAQTLQGIPGWQGSDGLLAEGITATLPGNGFAPSVVTCSQWSELRIALATAFHPADAGQRAHATLNHPAR